MSTKAKVLGVAVFLITLGIIGAYIFTAESESTINVQITNNTGSTISYEVIMDGESWYGNVAPYSVSGPILYPKMKMIDGQRDIYIDLIINGTSEYYWSRSIVADTTYNFTHTHS